MKRGRKLLFNFDSSEENLAGIIFGESKNRLLELRQSFFSLVDKRGLDDRPAVNIS